MIFDKAQALVARAAVSRSGVAPKAGGRCGWHPTPLLMKTRSTQSTSALPGGWTRPDYGFDAATAQIQIFTEFYGAPDPERVRRPIPLNSLSVV